MENNGFCGGGDFVDYVMAQELASCVAKAHAYGVYKH